MKEFSLSTGPFNHFHGLFPSLFHLHLLQNKFALNRGDKTSARGCYPVLFIMSLVVANNYIIFVFDTTSACHHHAFGNRTYLLQFIRKRALTMFTQELLCYETYKQIFEID